MKTSELIGADLDRAVAQCENTVYHGPAWTKFSTDWAQGGPIIERQKIDIEWIASNKCRATYDWMFETFHEAFGPTPLIAAMRCYVTVKLGDEVNVPGERAKDWTGAPLAYRIPGLGRFSS